MSFTLVLTPQKQKLARYLYYGLPVLALLFITIYSSLRSTYYFTNIQDDLLYPYLFQHFQLHDLIVPANHANILKFPLFWLQAILPYNYISVVIVDIALATLSIAWWTLLLVIVLGKRYAPLICTLLASILLAAVSFHINFTETTIRNIEYPIGFSFILVVNAMLGKGRPTKYHYWLGGIVGLLFAAAIAGDSFVLFAFTIPLLVMLGLYWLQTGRLDKRLLVACGLVVGTTLMGIALRKIVVLLGIVSLFSSPMFSFQATATANLVPSFTHAIKQLIDLSGGNVFGRSLSLSNLLYGLNLIGLFIGVTGLVMLIISTIRSYYRKSAITTGNLFVLGTLAFSFFITFAAYIFSNLVVIRQPDGTFADAYQSRYITLLPLLLVIGTIALLKRYYPKRYDLISLLMAGFAFAAVLSVPSVNRNWQDWHAFGYASHQTILNIVKATQENDVREIVTADSLGAPVRFWSHNTASYLSITDCTKRFPYNTRRSWGKPTAQGNTALVIDTTGLGGAYWSGCDANAIKAFYGNPVKIITTPNLQGSQPIQIWVYTYDIRQKLAPL